MISPFQQSGNGYFVEMATRPQTIGYALHDSPVALAAWMADHDTDAQPLPPPTIPFGFTTFPGEIWRTPRSWVDASYPNVVYFHEVDKGGHFAAWEEPGLFAGEIRAAFRTFLSSR